MIDGCVHVVEDRWMHEHGQMQFCLFAAVVYILLQGKKRQATWPTTKGVVRMHPYTIIYTEFFFAPVAYFCSLT